LKVAGVQQQPLPTQPHAPPLRKPEFDLKDLRAIIPSHCFERNAGKSLAWVARDLVIVACLCYAASYIDTPAMPHVARVVLWPLYWYLQGLTLTGVWVLAHECGHQAFSDYRWLNDTVGWLLHSALLVPYFR
jgi:omega-6 fatty acid desaturase (delta-12 desaturase)